MARCCLLENLLTQNVGSIVNYLYIVKLLKSPNVCSQVLSTTASCGQWHQSSNLLAVALHPTQEYPLSSTYCTVQMRATNHNTCNSHWDANALIIRFPAGRTACEATRTACEDTLPVRPLRLFINEIVLRGY